MNKTVLITGASRGLGRAIALEYASNNYNVVINYCNDEASALKVDNEIRKLYDVDTLVVRADISNEDDIDNLVKSSIDKFGSIDILVNNAAIAIDTCFEDKTKDNFMRTLEVNLVGTFLVSKRVGLEMLKNKRGSIINISSTNGIDTEYVESIDYDASKAGVISLTKNLAKYFSPYINVNCVAPGWINTDMNKELDSEFIEEESKNILLNRFAEVEEISGVVYFLSTDKARYINGSVIRVDGGIK